jgi:hypothetical protein
LEKKESPLVFGKGGKVFDTPKGSEFIPPPDIGFRFFLQFSISQKRIDGPHLPWRPGRESQLGKEEGERLDVLSTNLRRMLRESASQNDKRPDVDKLRRYLTSEKNVLLEQGIKPAEWRKPEAIPTLLQLLQAENTSIRVLLVELLASIEGKEATITLAQRAIFDTSHEVREKAIETLSAREGDDYRPVFLDALRWPWPAIADRAAEALVALRDKKALIPLVHLLKEPDPGLPFVEKVKNKEVLYKRELVQMNHMCNCMVCHAVSTSKADLVRGRVPIPGEDPPPLYSAERTGTFVRADITFLRQIFSVVQPVTNAGKWPGNQRFDYMIRKRPLTKPEIKLYTQLKKENKLSDPFEQREAVLFALKNLSGKDLGKTYENWVPLLSGIVKEKSKK